MLHCLLSNFILHTFWDTAYAVNYWELSDRILDLLFRLWFGGRCLASPLAEVLTLFSAVIVYLHEF